MLSISNKCCQIEAIVTLKCSGISTNCYFSAFAIRELVQSISPIEATAALNIAA